MGPVEGVFFIGGSAQFPSDGEVTVRVDQKYSHVVTEAVQTDMEEEGKGVKFMVERAGKWDELCTLNVHGPAVDLITAMSCTANMGLKMKFKLDY